jgi:uncharacterized protein
MRHIVDLKDLENGKIALEGSLAPGELDFSGEGLAQSAPLDWNLTAERAGQQIRIVGSLATTLATACSRCLEPAEVEAKRSFDLYFRERDEKLFDQDDEIELTDDDTRTAFFSGTALQIGEILREQVLLALPMKALCALDCKGLCPTCGTNLNSNACACAHEDFSPHMDRLLEIKHELEKRS